MPWARRYRGGYRRPYASRFRSRGFRRRTFRRRFRSRRIRGNPVMPSAFPRNRIVKLRYVQPFELDPANGVAFASQIFSASSIFDPDQTGSGHQPMGHDQWATWYNKYCVIGSKISVRATTISSTAAGAAFGVRTIDLASSGHTTVHGLMETPTARSRLYTPNTNAPTPPGVTATYSAKKWWNLANVKDNQDRIGASFGSDPSTQVYFHCFYGQNAPGGIGDMPAINFLAKITYIVLLSHPRELAQS